MKESFPRKDKYIYTESSKFIAVRRTSSDRRRRGDQFNILSYKGHATDEGRCGEEDLERRGEYWG